MIEESHTLSDRMSSKPSSSDMIWISSAELIRYVWMYVHKSICLSAQVVEDGYEFFAKRQLVTLFSAPNYCGEFDNAGAMMSVDETLMCSFQVGRSSRK